MTHTLVKARKKEPDGDVDDNYGNVDNARLCSRPVDGSCGRMAFSDICCVFS